MNKTNRHIKIAILTTPHGIFMTSYLVKNLNIAGIIIDHGNENAKNDKRNIWKKMHSLKAQSDFRGSFSIVMAKITNFIWKKKIEYRVGRIWIADLNRSYDCISHMIF